MKTPKKPPPDNVGNLQGRIRALLLTAHQNARAGGSLNKELRAIAPQLKKLRSRLARVSKAQGTSPSSGSVEKSNRRGASKAGSKKPKSSKNFPEDLLATLDAL